jgi:hypothetical protein
MNATNVPARRPGRAAASTLSLLLLTTGIAACGGNSDDERLRREEIASARAEGAREAKTREAIKDAKEAAARAQREIERLKRQNAGRRGGGSGGSGGGSAPPAGPSTGSRSCGGGLSVNSSTSCPFGENVRSEYLGNGRPSSVEVYSPVTGRVYTMRCTSGATTACTGGNNAAVYFP